MARKKKSGAFDVDLTPSERTDLASDLCTEIEDALSARSAMIGDGGFFDMIDWFYEQGRTDARDLPFPGAADLTSYIITEKVDSARARLVKAVYGVTPLCFVEAWGADAANGPYVEAFMDWKVKESTLKSDLAKAIHGALIEDCYVIEVSERIETQRITETIDVAIEADEMTGAALFADGQPKLKMDEDGEPVLAQEGEQAAKVERTHTKTKRMGPQYDPISMKDFVFLPGHAKSRRQVWGYAYRCWDRVPELEEKVMDGIYDADAVKAMGEQSDRVQTQAQSAVSDIAPQTGKAVEKELFQISLKRDLDGDGREEWYLATVSLKHRELLRLKLDMFVMRVGIPRCVPIVLAPRRNSVYGYSWAGDKLLTLAEEHTALRNMKADRSALATNAPIMQVQGGLWDSDTQPIGVGRKITVRDLHELQVMQIPDVPNSVVEQEQGIFVANERVSGLSDTATVGTQARQSNTLGQDQMISRASAVRVDELVGYVQQAIADIMQLSHAIWVDTLEAEPKGLEAPPGVLAGLSQKGSDLPDGRFTVAQIKGKFHFEPYGSDANADPERRQSMFNNKFMTLANLGKVFAPIQAVFQSPQAAKALVEEWGREYSVKDIKPYLAVLDQMMMAPPPMPGMVPPPGGAPPGAPPVGGPPDLGALMAMMQGGGGGGGY